MNQGIKTACGIALLLITPFFVQNRMFAAKEVTQRCPFCSPRKIDCPHCDEKDFNSNKEYKSHFIKVHTKLDEENGKKNIYCIPCQKSIRNSPINMHLQQKCHIKNLILCPFCEKTICRKTELNDHIYRKHILAQKMSPYDIPLLKHIEDLHLSGDYLCKTCQKGFVSKRILEIHEKIHTKKKRKTTHSTLLRNTKNRKKTILRTEPDIKHHGLKAVELCQREGRLPEFY